MRYIESQLQAEPRLPLSSQQMDAVMRRAERARAEAIAAMFARLAARIGAYFHALLESAAKQTDAGLRHN